MKVTTKPFVSIILHNLIDWAKCFLATYGEYPSLYDLIDTPKHVLLRLQQHLHNSTFPDPLLPQSRGPSTLQNEPIALQPHLAVRELDLAMCVSPSSNGSKMRSLWTNQMKS